MTDLLDALRAYNIAACLIVAALSAAALLKNWFPPHAGYLRFLRLGQIGLVLTIGYATVKNLFTNRAPTETTAFFAVFLTWSLIGTAETVRIERRRRREAR